MISIPSSFFEEEEREGFTIPEVMKKNWANQLCLLDEILEVADKHNIKIWVDYGTLLGAVRHHGYIPWDDDLDTSVFREDFASIAKYLQEELPSYRNVSSFYTTDKWDKSTIVVSTRRNFDIGNSKEEAIITQKNYNFPCSGWVDIFPMDYVPDDPERWNLIKNLYSAMHNMALNMDSLIEKGEFEEDLIQLESLIGTSIKRDENLRQTLWMLSEDIASMTSQNESNYIGYYPGLIVDEQYKRPLSAFSEMIQTNFEMIKVPIPRGYDSILKINYGDYLVPKRESSGHDYPHFKHQEFSIIACNKIGQLGDVF